MLRMSLVYPVNVSSLTGPTSLPKPDLSLFIFANVNFWAFSGDGFLLLQTTWLQSVNISLAAGSMLFLDVLEGAL